MIEPPELGVGVVFTPGLEEVLEAGLAALDVIEIEPQTFWIREDGKESHYRLDTAFIDRVNCFHQRKIVHGVGFPVGGTSVCFADQISAFNETIASVDAAWASEHLSFNRVECGSDCFSAGFLLPPLQNREGVAVAAANIRQLKSQVKVPFAFETGVNYLQPQPGELSDGTYFSMISKAANCGILLDLHNLWANEQNGRQDISEVLDEIPLDRVWEVHLAGGEIRNGYWLDAHSDLIPEALMKVAAEVIPRLPNLKALIFEIVADYIPAKNLQPADFEHQFEKMQGLWASRGSNAQRTRQRSMNDVASGTECLPSEWELVLGSLVIGRSNDHPLARRLEKDPGIAVYQDLIASVRGGMAVSGLQLTCRLIRLHLGEQRFREILERFWNQVPPEPFASEEVINLAQFLNGMAMDIPHLSEVLDYECALQRAVIEGNPQTVVFSAFPSSIIGALREGRTPRPTGTGTYPLKISADQSGERISAVVSH